MCIKYGYIFFFDTREQKENSRDSKETTSGACAVIEWQKAHGKHVGKFRHRENKGQQ